MKFFLWPGVPIFVDIGPRILTFGGDGTTMEPYSNHEGITMSVAITVKNVPNDLYACLKKRAGRNRRSINSEIICIFEEALTARPVKPGEVIAAARAFRERTRDFTLDQSFLDEAKREGRS